MVVHIVHGFTEVLLIFKQLMKLKQFVDFVLFLKKFLLIGFDIRLYTSKLVSRSRRSILFGVNP